MNSILTFLSLLFAAFIIVVVPSMVAQYAPLYGPVGFGDGIKAVLLCGGLATVAGLFIYRSGTDGHFLLKLFLFALLLRVFIGTLIFVANYQDFFGGDAWTYDFVGLSQLSAWSGDRAAQFQVDRFVGKGEGSGWGMVYLVAAIYSIVGRNMLAVPFFNAGVGAATAPIIFLFAQQGYGNPQVARLAAPAVAVFPRLG